MTTLIEDLVKAIKSPLIIFKDTEIWRIKFTDPQTKETFFLQSSYNKSVWETHRAASLALVKILKSICRYKYNPVQGYHIGDKFYGQDKISYMDMRKLLFENNIIEIVKI